MGGDDEQRGGWNALEIGRMSETGSLEVVRAPTVAWHVLESRGLIASQRPTATRVAGFQTWRTHGLVHAIGHIRRLGRSFQSADHRYQSLMDFPCRVAHALRGTLATAVSQRD